MNKSPVEYKQRCDGCGKMEINSKLTKGFGKRKCYECASYIRIGVHNMIRLPAFIMKLAELETKDILKIFVQKDGTVKLKQVKKR